ncbi:hypothetical protein AB0H88_34755 [Nonomuraea sp. NPDC050680]|uniref:hypothetical protein n=1 Tax=Nonomuraea sp. NPDC050680 TaxID=3154630 RepID=UPI0034117160
MLLIEVYIPEGRPDAAELGSRLTAAALLNDAEVAADPGVIEFFESHTNVIVREGGVSRSVVTVVVGAWAKEMAAHLIERIGAIVPGAEVYVMGVPDGGYGFSARARTSMDLTDEINKAKRRSEADAEPGTFIDPTCGAKIPAEQAITLERDGVVYGFCCTHCRGHFAKARAS